MTGYTIEATHKRRRLVAHTETLVDAEIIEHALKCSNWTVTIRPAGVALLERVKP